MENAVFYLFVAIWAYAGYKKGAAGAGYITVEVLTAQCVIPNAPVGDYRIKTVDELAELLDRLLS